ncbi:inter alpha-trypsin inhibitor, heavy chain 4-like isoform X10 [Xyrauchen texanus]|uniref:inter alpha-trypsin inhibitor, heavy chain 4-like isoform X10 n=1 Tax=Xyrauchen texanus TaxID=154827 RepID=UPI002242875B|nr:inter alpha-trypsin inhibitor, heavy chain 4-like isoform X10 [Xyrauchen texanus]
MANQVFLSSLFFSVSGCCLKEKRNRKEKNYILQLSINYEFVTPLTSMVVTKPQEQEVEIADKPKERGESFRPGLTLPYSVPRRGSHGQRKTAKIRVLSGSASRLHTMGACCAQEAGEEIPPILCKVPRKVQYEFLVYRCLMSAWCVFPSRVLCLFTSCLVSSFYV